MKSITIVTIITFLIAAAMLTCGIYTAILGAVFTTLIIFICAATTASQAVVLMALSAHLSRRS
jgi:hypothetical protein